MSQVNIRNKETRQWIRNTNTKSYPILTMFYYYSLWPSWEKSICEEPLVGYSGALVPPRWMLPFKIEAGELGQTWVTHLFVTALHYHKWSFWSCQPWRITSPHSSRRVKWVEGGERRWKQARNGFNFQSHALRLLNSIGIYSPKQEQHCGPPRGHQYF